MTLIELLVATTLAAALMGALMGILRATVIQVRMAEQAESPRWPDALLSRLRFDLESADSVHFDRRGLWITRGFRNASVEAGPRRINYQCIQLSQDHSGLARGDDDGYEWFAMGPQRILVERLDDQGVAQPLPSSEGPPPQRIRLQIWGADNREPCMRKDCVLW